MEGLTEKYTSRKRLLWTFEGKEIDRVAIYDIIHNRDLIEFATGAKITPKNAEDLMCTTAGKYNLFLGWL